MDLIEIVGNIRNDIASHRRTNRTLPFVTLTYAQTLDGSITSRRGASLAISSSDSLKFTHMLRAAHDAIFVGVETIISDNPSLTVRLVSGQNPRPVIIDPKCRTPTSCKIIQNAKEIAPIILVGKEAIEDSQVSSRRKNLELAGAVILECKYDPGIESKGRNYLQMEDCFRKISEQFGIRSIMIEGGAFVIRNLVKWNRDLIDNVILTIAPIFVRIL